MISEHNFEELYSNKNNLKEDHKRILTKSYKNLFYPEIEPDKEEFVLTELLNHL